MAAIIDYYLTARSIEQMLKEADGKGLAITISISDLSNQYGKNVTAYKSQTKEQREAKMQKQYYGGGKVVWTDGSIKKVQREEPKEPEFKEFVDNSGDYKNLPF